MNFWIRWMIRRDLFEVLAIEDEQFPGRQWTADDYCRCLRQRDHLGMVCELGEKVVGMFVFQIKKEKLFVKRFACIQEYADQGATTVMIDRLKSNIGKHRRRLLIHVPESRLDWHIFLAGHGFSATGMVDFEDGEDAIEFVYPAEKRKEKLSISEQAEMLLKDAGLAV